MSCVDLLIVLGGALEAIGIGVVAWEIRKDLTAARKLRHRVIHLSSALSAESAMSVKATGGRPPTQEERLERLERRADEVDDQIKAVKTQLGGEIQQAKASGLERVDELRGWIQDFLDELLTGGWRVRAFGVASLLAGIALTVIGSIAS